MKRDEYARNLAAGTDALIVLDVLRDGPSYGYGIRKRVFEQSRPARHWQDGTIYPVLRPLEKQGLVTSVWQGPKGGRPHRYYRLTPRGQRAWAEQRRQWRAFPAAGNARRVLRQT